MDGVVQDKQFLVGFGSPGVVAEREGHDRILGVVQSEVDGIGFADGVVLAEFAEVTGPLRRPEDDRAARHPQGGLPGVDLAAQAGVAPRPVIKVSPAARTA